jgi:adenine phosphoribosyltransferase
MALGVGFVPVRKPGKLPLDTLGVDYELEYGTDRLEMHTDAFTDDDVVVVVDDVLATGGTAAATTSLIEQSGARVGGLAFLLEIGPLGGRKRLVDYATTALITC